MRRKYLKLKNLLQIELKKVYTKIWYKYLEINTWAKVSLFWSLIIWFSLFLPWIQSLDGVTKLHSDRMYENAFTQHTWYIGYFITALIGFVIFSIISNKRKERLKYFSLLDIPESILIFFTASLLLVFNTHYFFIIWWFQIYNNNIIHGSGFILCYTWSLILIIWCILMRYWRKVNNTTIVWYESYDVYFEKKEAEAKNMKLPF